MLVSFTQKTEKFLIFFKVWSGAKIQIKILNSIVNWQISRNIFELKTNQNWSAHSLFPFWLNSREDFMISFDVQFNQLCCMVGHSENNIHLHRQHFIIQWQWKSIFISLDSSNKCLRSERFSFICSLLDFRRMRWIL